MEIQIKKEEIQEIVSSNIKDISPSEFEKFDSLDKDVLAIYINDDIQNCNYFQEINFLSIKFLIAKAKNKDDIANFLCNILIKEG